MELVDTRLVQSLKLLSLGHLVSSWGMAVMLYHCLELEGKALKKAINNLRKFLVVVRHLSL